ncbi:hypothetical protein BJV74DRAFT_857006 [Russula compacta]|nr:hypothetical protein BJV74DRAFT_857006 [Russula compacta]
MSDFPRLIRAAAERFPHGSVAYEQIRQYGGQMRLHIQAIEIMKQFVGDVAFDEDPKGLLFYNSLGDFEIGYSDFMYHKFGSGRFVTIQTDFLEEGTTRSMREVDTEHYHLPHESSAFGYGIWTSFMAATSSAEVVRKRGSTTFRLIAIPLGKLLVLKTPGDRVPIRTSGVLILQDVRLLGRRCVVEITHNAIVLRSLGANSVIIAVDPLPYESFVPRARLPLTSWHTVEPSFSMADALADDSEEEGDGVEAA